MPTSARVAHFRDDVGIVPYNFRGGFCEAKDGGIFNITKTRAKIPTIQAIVKNANTTPNVLKKAGFFGGKRGEKTHKTAKKTEDCAKCTKKFLKNNKNAD